MGTVPLDGSELYVLGKNLLWVERNFSEKDVSIFMERETVRVSQMTFPASIHFFF